MPDKPEPTSRIVIDEPPPFLGTWPHVYTFVLCYLVALIIGLYFFSRAYAP